MPKRFRLKRFASEVGLIDGEALSFLFESFDGVTIPNSLIARMPLSNAELDDRKR